MNQQRQQSKVAFDHFASPCDRVARRRVMVHQLQTRRVLAAQCETRVNGGAPIVLRGRRYGCRRRCGGRGCGSGAAQQALGGGKPRGLDCNGACLKRSRSIGPDVYVRDE